MLWNRCQDQLRQEQKVIQQLQAQLNKAIAEQQANTLELQEVLRQKEEMKVKLQQTKVEKMEMRDELAHTKRQLEQVIVSPPKQSILSLEDRLRNQQIALQLSEKSLDRLLPDLTMRVASEIYHIQSNTAAKRKIRSFSKQQQADGAAISHSERLKVIQVIEKVLNESKQLSEETIVEYLEDIDFQDSVRGTDAILFVRDELKSQRIVQRDADGDRL